MKIDSFSGKYRFLSNFWPVSIKYEGIYYPSVENAYQAAKVHIQDRPAFVDISPGQAKRLGRQLPLIFRDWDIVKLDIMYLLNKQKFGPQEPTLRQRLIDTGEDELIEGNTWGDKFWGVCNGEGQNHLGRILMKIRAEIKNG